MHKNAEGVTSAKWWTRKLQALVSPWKHWKKEEKRSWGTWVTRSVKHQTLDFSSGHEVWAVRASARSTWSLLKMLSPPPTAPHPPERSMNTTVRTNLTGALENDQRRNQENLSSKQWESSVVLSLILARLPPLLSGGLSFDGSTIISLLPRIRGRKASLLCTLLCTYVLPHVRT